MTTEPTRSRLTAAFDPHSHLLDLERLPRMEPPAPAPDRPGTDRLTDPDGATETSVDPLNRLLRHELAAVEAYERVIDVIAAPFGVFLKTLLDEHQQRIVILRERLLSLHAQPAAGAGAWGILVRLAEGTAALMGPQMMMATLEELETQGVADYRKELANLDRSSRALVETSLLPAQEYAVTMLVDLRTAKPGDEEVIVAG